MSIWGPCESEHQNKCYAYALSMRRAVVFAAVLACCAADGINTRLYACNASSPTQLWQPGPTDNEIVQTIGGACLDVDVSAAASKIGEIRIVILRRIHDNWTSNHTYNAVTCDE